MKIRRRSYYYLNHDRQLSLALIRKRKGRLIRRQFVNKFKNRPCADCGRRYPSYVMDFDHRKGENKMGDIGHMFGNWSFEQIRKEIEKCDIVCANCHRIRTFKDKYAELAKVVTAHV